MENVVKEKQTLKKVLNIAFYVVLAIVFIYAMFALFSKKDDNLFSFLGITSLAVQSDSMKPEFEEGDLIFIRRNFDPADLEVDDVITYKTFEITDQGIVEYYNTHRIIETPNPDEDRYYFRTAGDNTPGIDPVPVDPEDIIGRWTGRSWSNFGGFVDGITTFLKSSLGFFLLIVIPALAFLIYEVFRFVKIYSDYNLKKQTVDRVKMQEDALEEAKKQLKKESEPNEDDNK
ncbi:MAG: signal peptidase I [Tenericutes bacterium]|jgi:signal peptidase I|nr:signal peptidase I [Mycoplasmatota bacterium]